MNFQLFLFKTFSYWPLCNTQNNNFVTMEKKKSFLFCLRGKWLSGAWVHFGHFSLFVLQQNRKKNNFKFNLSQFLENRLVEENFLNKFHFMMKLKTHKTTVSALSSKTSIVNLQIYFEITWIFCFEEVLCCLWCSTHEYFSNRCKMKTNIGFCLPHTHSLNFFFLRHSVSIR